MTIFYLLSFCPCLIVCSELPFSESLYSIRTSRFISAVHELTRFCPMWGFTELNFWTHLRAIFVLCVPFYKPAFAIICLTTIRFSIIDILSYQETFIWFSMPGSLAQWRGEIGVFYNSTFTFSNILIFCLVLSLPYGHIFCKLDLIKLLFLVISLILNGIMLFHFKKCRNNSLAIGVYTLTTLFLIIISNLLEYLWVASRIISLRG